MVDRKGRRGRGRGEEPGGQAASAAGRQWRAVPKINSPSFSDPALNPGRACDFFCVNLDEWKGVQSSRKVEKHLVDEYEATMNVSLPLCLEAPGRIPGLGKDLDGDGNDRKPH